MNKQMTKTSGTSLKKPQTSVPIINYSVTKKLSPPSLILIGLLYSMALVKVTAFYSSSHYKSATLRKEDIQKILDEKFSESFNHDIVLPGNYLSREDFLSLRREVIRELKIINFNQSELLKSKKTSTVLTAPKIVPTKIDIESNKKAIAYNLKNKNLLWTKYNQRKKRLEEKIEKQRNRLLYSLNLNFEKDAEKFRDFNDQSELLLSELKEDYHSKLRIFEKQKYLLVDSP